MRRRANVAAILFLLLALGFQTASQPPVVHGQQEDDRARSGQDAAADAAELQPAFVPGQLIIRFQPGVTEEAIQDFYTEYNLTEEDDLSGPAIAADENGAAHLKLAAVGQEVNQSLIADLERDERVLYAEPNYVLSLVQTTPDDPQYPDQWALNNTGQTGGTADADVNAPEAWDIDTGSSDQIVVVIDTGVDWSHEDLADNVWVNPEECPDGYGDCEADGVDDEDNGYVDDFYGVNVITGAGDPMDDYGHGTHVAGNIGAVGDNGTGVTGVNWDVQIVGCKFLSASGGGSTSDAIKCFNYVDNLKNVQGYDVVATNNSWGGGGASEALKDAMDGDDAPLHVCAAGNQNSEQPHYPASFDLEHIISVAATDHDDLYASFSNYGTPHVDLAAPGDDILSTVPTGSCPLCDPAGYGLVGGTSMATPHVAGAAALIGSAYPSLTSLQIKQRIMAGVEPLDDMSKTTLTNGRLNLLNSLEEDDTPPDAVTDLSVAAGLLTGVRLTWTATGDDGNEGVAQSYDVRYSTEPINDETFDSATQATGTPDPQPSGSSEEFLLMGLQPETTYYVALKVVDNVGNTSDLSNVVVGSTSAGTVIFEDDMEEGEGDWVAEGTDDLWHISEHRANSPTHAWYYGLEEERNYDTGTANSGTLTSPPIDLGDADDALLTFYEWSEVESSTNFDRTRVQVSTDGNNWETVFESHGTDDDWLKREIGLAPYLGDADTLYVRFWFDTVDNRFNSFEGWYIDDVQILVAQKTVPGETEVAAPNLVMQETNIGFSDNSPTAGDEVTVEAVVLNHGTAEANDIAVLFVDATDGGATPIGAPQTIGNIQVGDSATVQASYDTSGKVGERTIRVVVDPNNFIPESVESDNEAQKALAVSPLPMPNLVALEENIGFSAPQPSEEEPVTIVATILNSGGVEANEVSVQFVDVTERNPVPIGTQQTIASIPAGGSGTAQITYDITGMTEDRDIGIVVDPNNVIAESDESDNEAEATLEMAEVPAPNLVIDSANVGFDIDEPTEGDVVTIHATVRNEGSLAASAVVVQFVDNTGDPLPIGEQQTIESIPPGGSGAVQVTYDTTGRPGDRRIEVIADPYNFIPEGSESDNDARATLVVAASPAPNLVMRASNIGFTPGGVDEGATAVLPPSDEAPSTVTIHATVRNEGTATATNVAVQFLDASGRSPRPIGEQQTIDAIAAGDSATVQVVYNIANFRSDRAIQVVVDPNNFIAELDETDNEASTTLPIDPPSAPNLMMLASNIAFNPALPGEGDQVSITAIVRNTGTEVAEDILVQFIDITNSGLNPIGLEQTIDAIAPGESGTAHIVYDTSGLAGNRRIQVLVDSPNLIEESDESDNEAIETLPVEPPPAPNLMVLAENIGFNPSQPVVGDAVTVTVTVHNMGMAPAEDVVVQFVDITGGESTPIGDQIVIDSIAPGSSDMASIVYHTGDEAGDRRIRVLVDPANFILEVDESDNRATTTLIVAPPPAPNLSVMSSNIGFNPAQPTSGEVVTASVTILNNGELHARDVLVQFVDITTGDMEPVGEKQTIPLIPAGGIGKTQVTYDTRGLAGERRIRVMADPHAILAESDETDNEATEMLVVAPPPAANLAVLDHNIGLSHRAPVQGDVISVTATILNNGTADARNVSVQFVDSTGESPVPIGLNRTIAEIPAGSSGTVHAVYNTSGPPGERAISVVADPSNRIPEGDESDNEAAVTLEVMASAAPNLVMEDDNVGFSPLVPGSDDPVTIFATVRNEGSAEATDVVVRFMDVTDGSPLPIDTPQTIASIPAGGSGTTQVTYAVANMAEDREIEVVVDPNNTIPESDESDNEADATLEMTKLPAPNLVMLEENIGLSAHEPTEGDSVTINATVRNDGNAAASNVLVQFVDVTSGATPLGPPQSIDAIPAGGSDTVHVTYETAGKSGERTIQVVADPNNFIAESSEMDNDAEITFPVTELDAPNLVALAGNIGFNPPDPTEEDLVLIHAVILNRGTADVNDVAVQFMDMTNGAATPIDQPRTITRIAAGGNGTVQVTYDTAGKEGNRTIGVVVDPNNFIAETNEADNEATKTLAVAPPPAPNLAMLANNITFDPPNPGDGDLVTISAAVVNQGTADATDVVVRFEDITESEPVLIGKQQIIDTIAAGDSATAQVTYDTTDKSGTRQIQVIVDPNETIAESDEADNVATQSLEVAAPPAPNLVVTEESLEFDPAAPTVGDDVTVLVTVLNDGTIDTGNVKVRFFDTTGSSPVPIGTEQTIDVILAGGTGTAQVTYDTAGKEGERSILVSVDPNSLIAETNEDDNEATAILEVAPPEEEPPSGPNLVVSSGDIMFDPSEPTVGDAVTITVDIENDGNEDVDAVTVHILDTTEDEEVIAEMETDPIDAGDSATVMATYDTTDKEGEREITVVVDPEDEIAETNEADNEASETLTVSPPGEEGDPGDGESGEEEPGDGESGATEVDAVQSVRRGVEKGALPNLTILALDVTPGSVGAQVGDTVTVLAVLYNDGQADARNVRVQFMGVSNGSLEPLGEPQVLYLVPAGHVVPVRMEIEGLGRTEQPIIGVRVDPDNTVLESNETDNEVTVSVFGQGAVPPDRPQQPLQAAVAE